MPAPPDVVSTVTTIGLDSSRGVHALVGKVAGLQLSRRRPEFTLPPMHADLFLSSHAPLQAASCDGGGDRVFCAGCKSNRRFFCHVCLVSLVQNTPKVTLPCHTYFITDSKERLSKATGVQCALLAPGQVTLCRPEELPVLDPTRCVLLLPESGAWSVAKLVRAVAKGACDEGLGCDGDGDDEKSFSEQRNAKSLDEKNEKTNARKIAGVDAVVIIDSKWDAAASIGRCANLRSLQRVKLETHRTAFWRFHPQPKGGARDDLEEKRARGEDCGDDFLCSLEALFFFAKEMHESGYFPGGACAGTGVTLVQSHESTGTDDEGQGGALRASSSGPSSVPSASLAKKCHCHDDLFWFFSFQHAAVARNASTREYKPMTPQPRIGRAARRTERRRDDTREQEQEGLRHKKEGDVSAPG
jgi:hypothetical protein